MLFITKPINQELEDVLTLLKQVNLPIEGVKEHFKNFFVTKEDKTIVGCVGLEIYEEVGLLRSIALQPSFQGKGLGEQMVSKIEIYSVENRINKIYLLTETAEIFFLKLGYRIIPREETDPRIKQSNEFTTLCPSAPVMMKNL